jgi:hypothetical protein
LRRESVHGRPFKLPETVWAVLDALALCELGMLSWSNALITVGKGLDVYLFVTGTMVASELVRKERLFDYLAALAAKRAGGSAKKLFFLMYCEIESPRAAHQVRGDDHADNAKNAGGHAVKQLNRY